ncbi:MAG: hypothetical protein KF845_12105 [Cyclobacteriaceae bacterium]|nr:hypothetical protein [Cyclobacteriaceae bacterium]
MIAIHNSAVGFHPRWITYCEDKKILYKIVDCCATDIISQLQDCHALLWHHSQGNRKDILIAKQILFALEHTGFKVFPDFYTAWYFDDKVAQKYLLERIGAPLVPSYVFYEKLEAFEWAMKTKYPKVWKLRGGAGSANVRLVRTKSEAIKIIRKAFGSGFKQYDSWASLAERWRKYRLGKIDLINVIKGVVRLGYEPEFSKIGGRQRGYAYFQDFVPNNSFDIRVVVINRKTFAIKRMNRANDFRASGSGEIYYDKSLFNMEIIKLSLDIAFKLQSQCIALDYVYQDDQPLVVEISYGFSQNGYDDCPGYWDEELNWHEGKFNPQGWMVELILKN